MAHGNNGGSLLLPTAGGSGSAIFQPPTSPNSCFLLVPPRTPQTPTNNCHRDMDAIENFDDMLRLMRSLSGWPAEAPLVERHVMLFAVKVLMAHFESAWEEGVGRVVPEARRSYLTSERNRVLMNGTSLVVECGEMLEVVQLKTITVELVTNMMYVLGELDLDLDGGGDCRLALNFQQRRLPLLHTAFKTPFQVLLVRSSTTVVSTATSSLSLLLCSPPYVRF